MNKKWKYGYLVFVGCLFLNGGQIKNLHADEGIMKERKMIFLHHSTGNNILKGNVGKLNYKMFKQGDLEKWIKAYNKKNNTAYQFTHRFFPKKEPYGWNNYPYDYYNIWVKNGGQEKYKEEPTLEILTKEYDTIIWKHCFPVSRIKQDSEKTDIDSSEKTLGNYQLQYNALKEKLHQFPDTTFILWTGAALVKDATTEDQAERMRQFVDWVINTWDEKGDNIFLWDFYSLQTEGGLYLKEEYAKGPKDSHPNKEFSGMVAPLMGQRIVDVLEGRGDEAALTGKSTGLTP
jgi:uncharacterized protein YlzI (FlbEa/FlbD family)